MTVNDSVAEALREAQSDLARGDVAQARRRCEAIVRAHPFHGAAHNFFAIVEYRRGDLERALALTERAVSIEPRSADFRNSRGIVLQAQGRYVDALASYDEALSIAPRQAQTLYNRGIVLHALGRHAEALASYAKALDAQPHYPEALINQGNVLLTQKRFDEALACYDRAASLSGWARLDDRALAQNATVANGLVNRGIALQRLGRPQEALASHDRALALQPRYPDALLNRGIALESLGRSGEALAAYEHGLRLEPQSASLVLKRADALADLGRLDEALRAYRSLGAMPAAGADQQAPRDRAAVEALWTARRLCAWDDLADAAAKARGSLLAGAAPPNPFVSLCVFDDPGTLLDCARRYAAELRHGDARKLAAAPAASAERIRIGYFSGESALRKRLVRAFDAFVDARELPDAALAERIAADRIDILVDLDGYTRRNRSPVLQFRPASVCVHYLGFPGTLGSPDVDYLIADSYVIPADDERFFSEAVVRLPGCYQASDDKREIGGVTPARRDAGLPDDAFVFCAFNRPYKITPEVFDVWIRILRAVPNSVLWLLRDTDRVEERLKHEAAQRGIAVDRMVFAPRVAPAEHLARHRLADLFLDTWPICAHTTASDALWSGLPIVTYPGRTFASRVAGSLLTAIGLPELIATSVAAYEDLAASLARNPPAIAKLRETLGGNRRTYPLFDTKRSCRNLERAFETMWAIHRRGEPPRGFALGTDLKMGSLDWSASPDSK